MCTPGVGCWGRPHLHVLLRQRGDVGLVGEGHLCACQRQQDAHQACKENQGEVGAGQQPAGVTQAGGARGGRGWSGTIRACRAPLHRQGEDKTKGACTYAADAMPWTEARAVNVAGSMHSQHAHRPPACQHAYAVGRVAVTCPPGTLGPCCSPGRACIRPGSC